MTWEFMLKNQLQFKGNEGHSFETTSVPFDNYDSENNGWPEDGNCVVKGDFTFGVREHGLGEVSFHVTEIILQDAYADDNNPPEITIEENEDFFADWQVEFSDKIWPTQVQIWKEENGKPKIEVL